MGPLKYFFNTSPVLAVIVLILLAVIAVKFIGFIFSHLILFALIAAGIFLYNKYGKKK